MRNYTVIPLSDLNAVRAMTHRYKPPGYRIRTFFLGPRLRDQRQTVRENAVAAKIAIYAGRRLMSYV